MEQAIYHANGDTLHFLRQGLQSLEFEGPLLELADKRLATLLPDVDMSPTTPTTNMLPESNMRARLVAVVELILEPLHVDWMDDESTPNHATIQRALDDIRGRFEKSANF